MGNIGGTPPVQELPLSGGHEFPSHFERLWCSLGKDKELMNTEKHNIQLLWKFCTQYMQNYLNRDSKLNTINVENRYFNNIFSCSQCGLKNVIIEMPWSFNSIFRCLSKKYHILPMGKYTIICNDCGHQSIIFIR